jgi:hypothetical protein
MTTFDPDRRCRLSGSIFAELDTSFVMMMALPLGSTLVLALPGHQRVTAVP